jgi:epoxyqueuosine reductase QueG
MRLSDHPTVRTYRETQDTAAKPAEAIDADLLKRMAREAGADDAGIADLARETLAGFESDLQTVLPGVRSVMVLLFRVNQNLLRSQAHAIADNEFKMAWAAANRSARRLVRRLRAKNLRAVNMPAGFPMEANRWPGRMWLTSDKVLAVEAGLGQMGYNRLVLHPEYGAAVVLGTVLLAATSDRYDRPLDFNPCIECGLCLKVCPVGAIKRTDDFNFMSCYSHNYRERLGGFQNWIENIADSKDHADYRRRVSERETISMWQHLAIGAQTRCDRCMAVCPAGQAAVGDYLDDRRGFIQRYLEPFQNLAETIYVVKGSDAEQHVRSHFPTKRPQTIHNGIRPLSAAHFVSSLPLVFQPGQSKDLTARYHFAFTGAEQLEATVVIADQALSVEQGLQGRADLHITADSRTWIRFLAGETGLIKSVVTRKIKLKGAPKLLLAFARCFPS